jgi:hypothetical protein
MCEAARLLRAGPVDGVSSNAYLESMLLHARALAEFLVLSRSRPSDIRRQDFTYEWTPAPVGAVARLTDHVPTLDRHLSHLTWECVETGPPSWEYHQVADDVLMIDLRVARPPQQEGLDNGQRAPLLAAHGSQRADRVVITNRRITRPPLIGMTRRPHRGISAFAMRSSGCGGDERHGRRTAPPGEARMQQGRRTPAGPPTRLPGNPRAR